jgi:hypothetical protein
MQQSRPPKNPPKRILGGTTIIELTRLVTQKDIISNRCFCQGRGGSGICTRRTVGDKPRPPLRYPHAKGDYSQYTFKSLRTICHKRI